LKRSSETNNDKLDIEEQEYEEPTLEDFLIDESENSEKKHKGIFGRIIIFFLIIALLTSVFSVWVKMFNLPSFEFLKKSSELSKEAIVQTYKESIVTVEDGQTKGTGFNVSSNGKIITNFHIIEDMNQIVVSFPNGKYFQANVLEKDPILDFALLELDGENLPYLELEMTTDWQSGDEIVVIGNPLAYTRIAIEGRILPSSKDVMIIDAPIHKGNSGSPVINKEGRVIGIIYAKTIPKVGKDDKIEGFAIPVEKIIDYLK